MRLPDMVWGPVFPPPQPATAAIPTASKLTIILRPRHGAPNRTVAFSPPRCFESADFVIFMTSNPCGGSLPAIAWGQRWRAVLMEASRSAQLAKLMVDLVTARFRVRIPGPEPNLISISGRAPELMPDLTAPCQQLTATPYECHCKPGALRCHAAPGP